MEFYLMLYPN